MKRTISNGESDSPTKPPIVPLIPEIDFINGRVELMGKEVEVKTPYNFILSSIVKNNEQKF